MPNVDSIGVCAEFELQQELFHSLQEGTEINIQTIVAK